MSSVITPYLEMSQAIAEAGGEAFKKCYQCGTCSGTCPWTPISEFSIRKLVRLSQLGLEGIEDLMWSCSTCKFCVDRCPRGVEIIDLITSVRNVYAGGGLLPQPLRALVGSLSSRGNPWSGDKEKRNDWAQGKYPLYTEGMEYLFFPCCTGCYDQRNIAVSRAAAELLSRCDLSWGLAGCEVNCCGESVRKVGDLELFERLKDTNAAIFSDLKVKKIITLSPHCYYTFKNEYGGNYEVIHITELLAGLIKEGRVTPKKDLGGLKVTYHDPCYLGRHSGLYDAPREILRSLPGVEFTEMDRVREGSICCGGGGGGLWIERAKGERLSDFRVEEAMETGAEIITTACPYCIAMIDDSIRTANAEERLKLKDVTEILIDCLEE